MNLVPAIDVLGGRCVRLLQGDFDRVTHYGDDPLSIARGYVASGCRELHVVDLDGARGGRQRNGKLVRRMIDGTPLAVQLGGGIRDRATLATWFDAGVERAVVGSIAVEDPAAVQDWIAEYGPDRIVLALDCRLDADGMPRLATHGWARDAATTLWDCVAAYRHSGLRHVLCTDVGRDGTMSGPAIELYRAFRHRYPEIELQASGGVRHAGDLDALQALGVARAITGRALLDGCIGDDEVASFLRGA